MELAHRDGEHGEGRSDAERGHYRGHTRLRSIPRTRSAWHGRLWQERRLPFARPQSLGQHRQHAPDLARVPAGRGSRPRGAEKTVEWRTLKSRKLRASLGAFSGSCGTSSTIIANGIIRDSTIG